MKRYMNTQLNQFMKSYIIGVRGTYRLLHYVMEIDSGSLTFGI